MLRGLINNKIFTTALLMLSLSISNAWGLSLTDKTLPYMAPDVSFQANRKQHSLKDYQGRKVMLWMFSTWRHTCVAGVKALEKQQALLEDQDLVILSIRNNDNGGYPGPDMLSFMEKFGPYTITSNNWVLGESSSDMYKQLNPVKYPDIYFLIDEKGMIETVNTAPNLTMKSILHFASGTR